MAKGNPGSKFARQAEAPTSLLYLATADCWCNGNHESERPKAIRWRLEREIPAAWLPVMALAD